MSVAAVTSARNGHWLPLRFAWRELRGGLRGFYVFVACIALGSMAIAGVGSVAASLADGLSRQGQVILGGDLSFDLVQRQASPQELNFLQGRGAVSSAATMRAMARTEGGDAALVEMKAVDAAYPLFGKRSARSAASARCRAGATRRRVRRRGRSDAADAAQYQAGRAADDRRRHLRNPRRARPTSRTSSPAASASARACW